MTALGVLKTEIERQTPKLHNCVNVRVNPGQWSTASERSCPHDGGDGTVGCDGVRWGRRSGSPKWRRSFAPCFARLYISRAPWKGLNILTELRTLELAEGCVIEISESHTPVSHEKSLHKECAAAAAVAAHCRSSYAAPYRRYVRCVEGFPAHQQAAMLESSRWTHVPTSSERHLLCKFTEKSYVFIESESEDLIICFTAYKTVTRASDWCH